MSLPPAVSTAYYAYHDALLEIVACSPNTDLDGNYARFAEKALRVPTRSVLASLAGRDQIDLDHWFLAQSIAEGWRANLHALYAQVQHLGDWSGRSQPLCMEDRTLRVAILQRNPGSTAREIAQRIRGLSPAQARVLLGGLAEAGRVTIHASRDPTAIRYELAAGVESPSR